MYTQIFEKKFSRKFSFPSTLSRNFKNFQTYQVESVGFWFSFIEVCKHFLNM